MEIWKWELDDGIFFNAFYNMPLRTLRLVMQL